ncbi:MBL fold metallo-hydrolase [Paenibacillus agilis]|uniref:MBL fold metallo-hydrolase n=1 Tax=Paenibacillus agilis TaxID=3020863 RepID=A0A559J0U1_9BACL|nr:MBL fold metallo-hydrolase [Paenibacillus agilis]TVX93508.1 MBL fold metallo-hydrolase [Paenibacillus agilis]
MQSTQYPIVIDDPWFTVSKLDETTFAISEYGHWEKVHSFLLIGQERAALIDTGLGIDNMKRMTDQLTDLPIIVLTTHVHADHIGSHGQYEEIYVHEAEEDWLVSGIKKLSIEQIRKDISRDITRPVPASFDPETYTPFQGKPTGLLRDGDVIELGERALNLYHTPGHSPGHISIYDTSRGYLFTGDLLYDETPVYAFFPTTSPEDLVNSLERIATKITGIQKIFGAHNRIGLEPELLETVKEAVGELRGKKLVRFGTGVHQFDGFSVRF